MVRFSWILLLLAVPATANESVCDILAPRLKGLKELPVLEILKLWRPMLPPEAPGGVHDRDALEFLIGRGQTNTIVAENRSHPVSQALMEIRLAFQFVRASGLTSEIGVAALKNAARSILALEARDYESMMRLIAAHELVQEAKAPVYSLLLREVQRMWEVGKGPGTRSNGWVDTHVLKSTASTASILGLAGGLVACSSVPVFSTGVVLVGGYAAVVEGSKPFRDYSELNTDLGDLVPEEQFVGVLEFKRQYVGPVEGAMAFQERLTTGWDSNYTANWVVAHCTSNLGLNASPQATAPPSSGSKVSEDFKLTRIDPEKVLANVPECGADPIAPHCWLSFSDKSRVAVSRRSDGFLYLHDLKLAVHEILGSADLEECAFRGAHAYCERSALDKRISELNARGLVRNRNNCICVKQTRQEIVATVPTCGEGEKAFSSNDFGAMASLTANEQGTCIGFLDRRPVLREDNGVLRVGGVRIAAFEKGPFRTAEIACENRGLRLPSLADLEVIRNALKELKFSDDDRMLVKDGIWILAVRVSSPQDRSLVQPSDWYSAICIE